MTESRSGHGGEGEGEMKREIRFDVYALPCVRQIASGHLPHSTGSSARCSVMTYRGGKGDEREGMFVYISRFTLLYSRN